MGTDKKIQINTDRILQIIIFILLFGFSILVSAQEDKKEEELFFIAQQALEDGFYDISEDYFKEFIDKYPHSRRRFEAELFLGQCYYNKGNYLKALSLFESLLKRTDANQLHDGVLFWIAQVHLEGKDYQRARDFLNRIISNFPESKYTVLSHFYKAKSFFDQEKFSSAIEIWQNFIKTFPEHELKTEADFKIGEAMYRLKEYKTCLLHFEAFLKFYPKSAKVIEARLYRAESEFYLERYAEAIIDYLYVIDNSKNPETLWQARLGLAWSYLKQKKFKESEEAFLNIKKELVTKDIFTQARLGMAYLLREQKDYPNSLEIYDEIINSKSQTSFIQDAYIAKAELLYEMGKFPESIETYNEILQKFSDSPYYKGMLDKLHYNLAWAHLKSGDFKKSIEEFQKVAKISQDKIVKISALCQVADTYLENNKLDEAIDIYASLLRDYPDSFYADYAQYQLANALYKKRDFNTALLAFRSLLKNYPNSRLVDETNYAIILVYFSNGDYLAALQQSRSFVKNFSDHSLIKDALYINGVCLYNLSRFKEAINIFVKVQSKFHKDKELVVNCEYQIADSYLRMGNEKEALQRFKRFLHNYPDSRLSLEILLWLGDYFLKQDKPGMARYYVRQAINKFRGSESIASAYYLFAQSFFVEGDYPKALEWFDKAGNIAKDKLVYKVLIGKADTLVKLKMYKEALSLYQDIADTSVELSKSMYIKIAELLRRQEEFASALDLLKKALDLKPEELNAKIQFQIAEVKEQMQDYPNAISEYLKLCYIYPDEKELVVKSLLRAADLSERQKQWQSCLGIYKKLIDMEVAEAKYAQERIDWIERNILLTQE